MFQKTLELLERYGIHPFHVTVTISASSDGEYINWNVTNNYSTSPEQMVRLQQLHTDLDMVEKGSELILEDDFELYNILCKAITKAPKSFTRHL